MEVEIGNEVFLVELVTSGGELSGNMPMSEVFSDGASIFAFYKGIIIAPAWSTFGLGNNQFIEEFGNGFVDEFAAIIRMEVFYGKRI